VWSEDDAASGSSFGNRQRTMRCQCRLARTAHFRSSLEGGIFWARKQVDRAAFTMTPGRKSRAPSACDGRSNTAILARRVGGWRCAECAGGGTVEC